MERLVAKIVSQCEKDKLNLVPARKTNRVVGGA